MYAGYITKRKIRSERTAETYKTALRVWARSRGVESPDLAIQEIRTKGTDPYTILQEFVNHLHSRKLAPKTILSYVVAVKGFLLDCDFDISPQKLRAKVVMPQQYEVSTDRAPTVEEVRRLLLRGNLATKAAISMLCSSGLRLGELGSLRVCDIKFGGENEPAKITLKAARTKTRKSRVTFMTAEAAGLLKEYLAERIGEVSLIDTCEDQEVAGSRRADTRRARCLDSLLAEGSWNRGRNRGIPLHQTPRNCRVEPSTRCWYRRGTHATSNR